MNRNLHSQKLSEDTDRFIRQMHFLDRADNPKLIFRLAINWTKGQPLLTKKLLQYLLESKQKIVVGQEAIAVERIVRNRLIKEFKQDELTLLIRKLLYGKDLISLLKKTKGKICDRERIYLENLQSELGLSNRQVQTLEQQCLQAFASANVQITHQPRQYALVARDENTVDDSYQDLISLIEKSPIYDQLSTQLAIKQQQNQFKWPGVLKKSIWLCLAIPFLLLIKNLSWSDSPSTTAADVSLKEDACVNFPNNESP